MVSVDSTLGNGVRVKSSSYLRYRKLNTPPSSIEDRDILKMYLVNPPVKKIDLVWPLGLSVTARNLKGVTIKDALDAIYKQFKKKACLSTHVPIAFIPIPTNCAL